MPSPPPGGDWRHAAKPAAPQAGASRRPWQPGGAANAAKPAGGRKSRTGRFLLAGMGTGLLVGLIILVIWLIRPPKYPNLVVVAPNPAAALALDENAAGATGAALLSEWALAGGDRPRPGSPTALTDRDSWKARLEDTRGPLVLYFAAHGGADRDGPFLWVVPADARGPADAHKLRVREILDRLAGLPKDQPKLLVFDATRVGASWPHGLLFNDFARALQELDGDIARIDGLAVVCASDADQRSWVSEEWRESVFGHYLREGMAGAAGRPGDRVTAATLFDFVTDAVGRWALANRDEKQTPVLLPKESGRDRAARVELASVPPAGFQPAATPDAPGATPPELAAAWETAWSLAARTPAPDTTDPLRWREYLALLGRWERLVRVGGDTQEVRNRATTLANQLAAVYGTAEPVALAAAVPVGRALGLPPTDVDPDAFRRLWSPPPGTSVTDEWAKQNKNTTPHRIAVARMVVDRVYDDPTPATLKTADELLRVVDGAPFLPAEAHYVRMLHRHLNESPRPPKDAVKAAVGLRREAEEAAWLGGADPAAYPYAEQVFRWTRGTIEAGDRARQLGQDLLFDADAKSWVEAAGHFNTARGHYAKARADAKVVAASLAARDKVLARLPYYARWAAGDRGKRPAAETDSLLARVEAAARAAHQIATQSADVPADAAARDKRVAELDTLTRQATEAFDDVAKAFADEAAALTNVPHPSNWHALDNVLGVPFLPARDRDRLFKAVRHVSYRLAVEPDRPSGGAPATPVQEMAKRQGRMAIAVLGDVPPDVVQLVSQPELGAWWKSYRDAGDRIGRRFQALPDESRDAANKAATTAKLSDAAPHLARSAYLARLADPAAALRPQDEPPVAEQHYWQHYLLLWQASRTTAEGWADVAPTRPDDWYCRKAAKRLIATAAELARGPDPNLPPAEIDRRLADSRVEEAHKPVELALAAPPDRDVADEPAWDFAFSLARRTDGAVGVPVYWLDPPGKPYALPDPDVLGRRRLDRLADGEPSVASPVVRFKPVPRAGEVPAAGKLRTTVFYRGHQYEQSTAVWLAGAPTLDWNHNPPPKDAPGVFSVMAKPEAVAGAVTLLIDRSGSMDDPLPRSKLTKIQATFDALERVLTELPRNTRLTVAFFWGDAAGGTFVETVRGVKQLEWRQEAVQIRDVLAAARAFKPEGNTPLARGVRKVLDTEKKQFWPEGASGVRTLIVLTDGADSYADRDGDPGPIIRKHLLDGEADTEFHLIFFGLDGAAKAETDKQYRALKDKDPFLAAKRTPPGLWDANEVNGLVERMRAAMLPRVYYWREETAGAGSRSGRLVVTLPPGQQYHSSPLLPAGVYNLRGTRNPQQLQLLPGDRVALRADAGQGGFDLSIPPNAFRYAEEAGLPHATGKGNGPGGVHLALVGAQTEEGTGYYDLKMVTTMEPAGGVAADGLLRAPRPLFPWFDVDYPAGVKPEAGLNPTLRVFNRPGLRAPAWDVDVARWDANRAKDAARLPTVTGYWVEQLPPVAARYRVDLRNPEQAAGAAKPADAAGVRAELVGVTIEKVEKEDGSRLPPGDYLTVRMKYRPRADRVFVRAGGLKGTAQPLVLHERHLYFDRADDRPEAADRPGRYTARFGPLDPADLNTSVELEVYPVAAFKELAGKTGRRAAVTLPKMEKIPVSPQLELDPGKE